MARRPELHALAEQLGIASGYRSQAGSRHRTSDHTRVAILHAMGFDASDEQAAARARARLRQEEESRLLDPVQVVRTGGSSPRIRLRTTGRRTGVHWRIEIESEEGERVQREGRTNPRRGGWASVTLPEARAHGSYLVRLQIRDSTGERTGVQRLLVTPRSCFTVEEALGGRRGFGLLAHLYAVRSRRNWGAGDLGDLAALTEWTAEQGGTFLGINPLHAIRNRGWDLSPYNPVSRLYRNVLYLEVEAIPELRHDAQARERLASPAVQAALERCRTADRVEYEQVMALKMPILECLFRTFVERHRGRPTRRGRDYAEFVRAQGEALRRFATFLALEQRLARDGTRVPWQAWPEELRDPTSRAVASFRDQNADLVELHCYLQFELDRQLGAAARRAGDAGLRIGIYHDLAVGTAGDGSDPWSFPGLFAPAASVGAPPDDYAPSGQDWGFPPLDPRRLRQQGYDYWIRLLRAGFTHTGALRIDHAMGLLRLFWIPQGRPADEGTYVRYPAADLFGILALESRRHRAIVIGEDLGTVPRGFAALLARWGVLSSRVLYFERDWKRGTFHPAARYSARALVTATTHDHAPLAGYRRGRDLELRRAAGQISTDADLFQARSRRSLELAALEHRLRLDGAVGPRTSLASDPEFAGAVHRFLAKTSAPLVGVFLDDLTGETDPLNLPGVGMDRYPGWSRRLRLSLEQLRKDPGVRTALQGVRHRNRG